METTITATELARSLSKILSRVQYPGETFLIERNGKPVATLAPSNVKPPITAKELAAKLGDGPWPLEGFTDDLEEIKASQSKTEPPAWHN